MDTRSIRSRRDPLRSQICSACGRAGFHIATCPWFTNWADDAPARAPGDLALFDDARTLSDRPTMPGLATVAIATIAALDPGLGFLMFVVALVLAPMLHTRRVVARGDAALDGHGGAIGGSITGEMIGWMAAIGVLSAGPFP
jgi:hypothetical protein